MIPRDYQFAGRIPIGRRACERTANRPLRIALAAFGGFLAAAFGGGPAAASAPDILLAPADDDRWRADYKLSAPAESLTLLRASDGNRTARWTMADDAFELTTVDGLDVIRRRDGAPFDSVAVLEGTDYANVTKDYLPFARFGDGGLLIYTGRFHACPGARSANDSEDCGPWRVTVAPAAGQSVIANGRRENGAVVFEARGDGAKIYVGDGDIAESAMLLSVVDKTLPAEIGAALSALFPKLLAYFGAQLAPLESKQMLFVSYNVPGTEAGSHIKGGTLKGQVFMHFEGAQMDGFASEPDFAPFIAWFFAHEAGHLYQGHSDVRYDRSESWIHEGGADALAYFALRDLTAAPEEYLAGRIAGAREKCAAALTNWPLLEAADQGAFQTYYDCGFLLHLAAAASVERAGGGDYYALWRAFVRRVRQDGADWSSDTFIDVVATLGDATTAAFLRDVVFTQLDDPETHIADGLRAAGVEF